jgi:anti-sigma factor RsiW
MNCAEFEVLLHALIDGELDAGHAREVEAHPATCSACAEKLASYRAMREAMADAAHWLPIRASQFLLIRMDMSHEVA